jgi:MFS transporter, DHA1 family, multidrug resistance protein
MTVPRDLTRQTLLICAMIGTTQMTWGTIVPALPLYLHQFGATALILGPIIAAFGLGRALVNIPAGLALRWWRPRPFLLVVCSLLIAVTAVTGFSPNPAVLIVARVVAGLLGGAAITVGFAVLVAGAPPERRGWVMSTATAVQMSTGALGAFLGGLVLTWFPLPIAFVVAPVPLLIVLLVDVWRPARHYWAVSFATAGPTESPIRPRRAGLPLVVLALALAAFGEFVARFGGEQGLIPLLGYGRGGLTPFTLGLALAAATVVSLVAMPLVGRILDRGARLLVFVPGALAAMVAMLLFPVASGPWQYATIIVVYGLANCIAGVVPSVVTSEAVSPAQSGVSVGIMRTAGDIGAVVGPLVVLAGYAVGGGIAGASIIAGVVLTCNAPLVGWLLHRRRVSVPRDPRLEHVTLGSDPTT